MEAGPLGALPLHREPLLPCVAILCVDLSQHDKFVQVKNKAMREHRNRQQQRIHLQACKLAA